MKVLDKEFLGMGNEVNLFEKKLKEYIGREVICVSSGTAALHLACQAIGLKKGDEVLVQSVTYISSFQAISATGARPVACEVDPKSFTIDLTDAYRKISKRTKAIMPVHYAGGVGNLNLIYEFAKKNNLRVIEDAAHAFGTIYKNRKIGSIGDIVCFSFDGIKNITAGEGGAILSEDTKLINYVKDARLLGVKKDTKKRYVGKRSWNPEVNNQGWRYHMSNINAAIGIEQLKRIKQIEKKRKMLATYYDKLIANVEGVDFLNQDYKNVLPHIYPIIFSSLKLKKKSVSLLMKKKIETGLHYKPNHLHKFYKSKNKLPVSEDIIKRIISLPLHLDLNKKDIDIICDVLKKASGCTNP